MIDISIIIVSYNVKDLLKKCLLSIQKYATNTIEIIVVDNDSKDGTIELIKTQFPNTIIIANQKNNGFPKANNQAFRIAKGKYIFMLNPDTELIDNALKKLITQLETTSIDIIAPKLLNTDLSLQDSVWRNPSIGSFLAETFHMKFLCKKKYYLDQDKSQPFEAESFSGAAILFRREVLDRIGLLDEKLFWIEDIDFCYRAKKASLKLVYYPNAEIIHHIGQSAKNNYNISLSNQVFNKIKFFKKHHSKTKWGIVVFFSFVHCLFKFFIFLALSPFSITYYRKAKAYAYTLPKVFNPPIGIK
ncbi:MAG: glycosyl transferase family 2 [Flavobacteriales bacterium CG_4_9_14_0_2_um_filter_32_27]|nr:MAG: glycosyl transferase family 2 [Flavobacteriales bacterium CG_4_9_14_0_2_um_filter_32_27]